MNALTFDEAFEAWLAGARKILADYMAARFPNNPTEVLEPMFGARYVRVVKKGPDSQSGAAWAFVDRTNGDVLKPAGYKGPAKHARGNIFDEKGGLEFVGPYGPAYLK